MTNHLIGDEGTSFETQFPVVQPNETQDEFDARVVHFLKQVISPVLIFAVVGPQLSDDVHSKVFSGNFQSPEGILNKLTKTMRELSVKKKALCTVRKQSVPVSIAEALPDHYAWLT